VAYRLRVKTTKITILKASWHVPDRETCKLFSPILFKLIERICEETFITFVSQLNVPNSHCNILNLFVVFFTTLWISECIVCNVQRSDMFPLSPSSLHSTVSIQFWMHLKLFFSVTYFRISLDSHNISLKVLLFPFLEN
jgi:hypothetical protein